MLPTTQYLVEADLLADKFVVIDHGRIIASGTSDELKRQVGCERLDVTVADASRLVEARDLLEPLGTGPATHDHQRRTIRLPVTGGATVLIEALRRLDAVDLRVDDVGLRRPTLDDVFLILTGHGATDPEGVDVRREEAARWP